MSIVARYNSYCNDLTNMYMNAAGSSPILIALVATAPTITHFILTEAVSPAAAIALTRSVYGNCFLILKLVA